MGIIIPACAGMTYVCHSAIGRSWTISALFESLTPQGPRCTIAQGQGDADERKSRAQDSPRADVAGRYGLAAHGARHQLDDDHRRDDVRHADVAGRAQESHQAEIPGLSTVWPESRR